MRHVLIRLILSLTPLLACSEHLCAQTSDVGNYAGALSQPLRTTRYPESIYPHGVLPDWDRGYVIHYEIEKNSSPDEPMVVMYDSRGKRVLDGRIWPAGAASVNIRRTAAGHDNAILAAGAAILLDGSVQRFIAKTDLRGNTAKTVFTGSFASEQICEAEDGTVWSLGDIISPEGTSTDVLRQFSFEKGMLRSYLPRKSVQAREPNEPWFFPFGSFVRCGKNKVVVYLKFTDEYVEIDTKSFEAKRWTLDLSNAGQGKASGLAITEDGRVYGSFCKKGWGFSGAIGLFEVIVAAASDAATLVPVKGSLSFRPDANPSMDAEPLPPGTFLRLWGADKNDLAVWLADAPDVSWVRVIPLEDSGN